MAVISFDGRVNIAVRIVSEKYPESQLYEASGVLSDSSTANPTNLRVVFGNEKNTHVIIEETSFGEFGEPQLIEGSFVGDDVIEWPAKMSLEKANELKEKAGFKEPYNSVVLRKPVGPEEVNSLFIFGVKDSKRFIFVDTVTGKVSSVN